MASRYYGRWRGRVKAQANRESQPFVCKVDNCRNTWPGNFNPFRLNNPLANSTVIPVPTGIQMVGLKN